MGDVSIDDDGAISSRSLSRRNALKAGVAAGVGVAAWSGATITSLGGTPAYGVAGCTGVITLDLSGGCRNTDQGTPCPGGGEFRYHTLNAVSAPFSLANNPGEGTCCDVTESSPPTLKWSTTGITCVAHVEMWSGGQSKCANGTGTLVGSHVSAPSSNGTVGITVPMDCFAVPSNTFYKIYAKCATTGADCTCTGSC